MSRKPHPLAVHWGARHGVVDSQKSSLGVFTHWPVFGSQLSMVQRLLSSQFFSVNSQRPVTGLQLSTVQRYARASGFSD
jgi:hypothetical protein